MLSGLPFAIQELFTAAWHLIAPCQSMMAHPVCLAVPRRSGCAVHATPVTDAGWRYLVDNYFAMHTRYPKKPQVVADDPVTRAQQLLDAFFSVCSHSDCIPLHGGSLLDFDNMPPTPTRQQPALSALSEGMRKEIARVASEAAAKAIAALELPGPTASGAQ
jgi:hypothetical protein